MRVSCVVTLPGEMQAVSHDEGRIALLHQWIEKLCDPYSRLINELNKTVNKLTPKCVGEDLCSDAENTNLKRRVGSISVRGITSPEELETLEEEPEEGPVVLRQGDDTLFEGNYECGRPHGYFRHLNSFGDLEFFGCFYRGSMLGVCWKSLPGGGFLVSKSWDFTDPNMLYLYPDCRTGLLGSFSSCQLVSAVQCEVENFITLVNTSIPAPLVSLSQTDTTFTHDLANRTVFCAHPHIRDPYEAIFVEVRQSRIKDAGEGLFAKTDIEPGTILSFYNGVKVRAEGDWEKPTPYKMTLDEENDIDLPDSMTSLERYSATLGHKVCHSFKPNCETDVFYHPRFGLMRCIASLDFIEAGQEILIDYGYNLSNSPTWYKVAWAKHQKVVRGLPDWKTALMLNNMSLGNRRSSWLSDYNNPDY